MKKIFPVLARVLLIVLVIGGGYLLLNSSAASQNLPASLQALKILNFDTSKIADQAKEKFVDQQPIIAEETSSTKAVLGTNTIVTDQAKQLFTKTSDLVSTELKNLPKKEAAAMLRQTCEQLAAEIENN